MVQETVFGGVIEFLRRIGFYNIVLPFLIIFAVVYAILDKTLVLGKEPGTEEPRRNINAIVAFVISMIVIGSANLVRIVNEVMGNLVIVIMFIVLFIMTVSVFLEGGAIDFKEKHKGWLTFFMVLIFIIFLLIFLHGVGWLGPWYKWIAQNWKTDVVATIIFLIGVVIFIWLMVRTPKPPKGESSE